MGRSPSAARLADFRHSQDRTDLRAPGWCGRDTAHTAGVRRGHGVSVTPTCSSRLPAPKGSCSDQRPAVTTAGIRGQTLAREESSEAHSRRGWSGDIDSTAVTRGVRATYFKVGHLIKNGFK